MTTVETAAPEDTILDVLTLGFVADPISRWLYPESDTYLKHFRTLLMRFGGAAFDHQAAFKVRGENAAALWLPPNAHPDEAGLVAHFEAVVNMHRRSNAIPRAMGEALCELAFARLFSGQLALAMGESREGVQLMQIPGANGEYVVDGFLVRAMFKSAAIHLRGGQLRRGFALYRDALCHAQAKHLDDQYGQWKPSALARRVAGGVWQRLNDRFRR